jgi:hypothetical protein
MSGHFRLGTETLRLRFYGVQQGQTYNFTLLSFEVIKDQALVKLVWPLFVHLFDDLLGAAVREPTLISSLQSEHLMLLARFVK